MPHEWLPSDPGEDRLHRWLTQRGFVWPIRAILVLVAIPVLWADALFRAQNRGLQA